MKKKIRFLILTFLIIFISSNSAFIIQEHEQAIVLQVGKSIRSIKTSGLHWKIPFIQNVIRMEKRVLLIDGDPSEVPTSDKKFIWIDTTARWKITDPLSFYQTLRELPLANTRISTILDGITKDTVSSSKLIELVRNSNTILQDIKDNSERNKHPANLNSSNNIDELSGSVEIIKLGREKISKIISERASDELKNFGIHVLDVQIRSISYKEEVEEKVYNRMISERMKIATKIRSQAEGKKKEIEGQILLALKKIQSTAFKKSQETKGQADAQAIDIYTSTINRDPSFYAFMKTLETYKKTISNKTKLILSTDSEFLRLLNSTN